MNVKFAKGRPRTGADTTLKSVKGYASVFIGLATAIAVIIGAFVGLPWYALCILTGLSSVHVGRPGLVQTALQQIPRIIQAVRSR